MGRIDSGDARNAPLEAEEQVPLDGAAFDRLRRDYDVIPIVRVLSADAITPVAAFAAVGGDSAEAFLLESVEQGERLGRYSFIGFSPRRRLTFDTTTVKPIESLRDELVPLRVYGEERLPPFFGGVVGFFGYGVAKWMERLPDRHRDGLPDATLLFFDNVIAFDHLRQELFVIASVLTSLVADSGDMVIARVKAMLDDTIARLRDARVELLPAQRTTERMEVTALDSRESFLGNIARAKEEIAAGEIFQIVLSQRWECDYPTSESLVLYRTLRSINPSPYMFLLKTKECTLVGASPEMLVRAHAGIAETRPIAGTRRRGATTHEDDVLAAELLADEKENAEHLMLVDLGRNDLGRVCRSGSVEVTEFRNIERYSHVMHIVSHVRGRMADDVVPIDVLLSCFPAGTVSGAPKIRAMQLIDELESRRRGPYAGAVAYIGFSGNLDSCITIRTIVLANDRASVQAGAGIVHDSVPEKEYEEIVNKSAALRKAIGLALATIRRRSDG